MRAIIVGFGRVAETDHVPVYLERDVEIVAVVDLSPARLTVAQSVLRNCRVYQNLETAIKAEKVDFCDIATPPYAHAEMMQTCIQNRIPVICEKPFVMNRTELMILLQELKHHNTFVFPCHTWQYAPQIMDAITLVSQGMIHDPFRLETHILRISPGKGDSAWNQDWRTDHHLAGGGILMDHGYHVLYLSQALLQARPSMVHVLHFHKNYGHDVEFEIEFELKLAPHSCKPHTNSKTLHAKLTWLAPERLTSYNIIGEEGTVFIQDAQTKVTGIENIEWTDQNGGLTYSSLHPDWFRRLFDNFLKYWNAQQTFHDELLTACYTMETIWTCYQAAMHGKNQIVDVQPWLSFFDGKR